MSNVIPLRRSTGPAPAQPLVYTVPEVAELLGLGLGLTYQLVRSGEIPARKLGTRWVVPRAAFHAWLNSTTVDKKEAS